MTHECAVSASAFGSWLEIRHTPPGALAAMALGVGAAVFAVVRAILIEPFPAARGQQHRRRSVGVTPAESAPNPLLARASARTRELAIRTAIGASRSRLMRPSRAAASRGLVVASQLAFSMLVLVGARLMARTFRRQSAPRSWLQPVRQVVTSVIAR
jgi:hypothetical protein